MSRYRSQGIIVALLLGTLALILYGSLYPFELLPRVHTLTLRETLLEMSWSRSGRGDRIANILLYVPLGFCLFLLLHARIRRRSAVLWSTACGLILSYAIELTQVFIVDRVSSYWDVVFNVIGSFVGAAGGIAWYELTARLNSQTGARSRSRKSAMLVVLLWLMWRLWPFIPHFSLGKLKAAFQPLADPNFSGVATLHYLIWWALLAHIVFSQVSGQRAIEALLALIAIVLAASLGITAQGFVPSELLALVLLVPILLVLNRLTPAPRHLLLTAGFVGLLLYESFAPFQLSSTASHFELWPFKS
ncbi:MAG TPA: VanZ family protein, partial [Steroidobacteraceae bacterium]|nr:VanZ family protein [Steroidobacteraceae bacterium]